MKALLIAAAIAASTTISAAADPTAMKAFAFETAPTAKAGAAYVSLMTNGAEDRLIGAASDVAKRVEIHTHIQDGDVMRMRKMDAPLPVSPGAPIVMEPGGVHIMLMGLTAPLSVGEPLPITLIFEKAGEIEFDVQVIERGGHAGHKGNHDTHSGHSGANN